MNMLLYRGEKFNANFFHNSGVDIDHSFFLFSTARGKALLVPEMNCEYAKSKFRSGEVISYSKQPIAEIKKFFGREGQVCLDYASIPASLFLHLKRRFSTRDISGKLTSARAIKTPKERALIGKAAALARRLISNVGNSPEKTDQKTSNKLLIALLKSGVSPAFSPIIASGAESSYPHSTPTAKKTQSPLLIDAGVRLRCYNSDITRCFQLSREQKMAYEKLQNIFHLLLDEIPNLQTGGELALFARECYKRENLPYPPHSIGHGVGLDVHERPSLSSRSKDNLKGSVFTLEPSVYFPRKFGLRYEDIAYFDGKKARIL
ncbi:MAG: M24 family metallopeptidase [Candidatus Bilamarchaeaceae archaeon]